jgi:hypothetical protein
MDNYSLDATHAIHLSKYSSVPLVDPKKQLRPEGKSTSNLMNSKIITFAVQVCVSLIFYAWSLYMRRHLPPGAEAGWFRGALDGMNAVFYFFDSKEPFMTHPHSWVYNWFYWPNALLACYQWFAGTTGLWDMKPSVSRDDLLALAEEMNKECPKQLDEFTRLDGGVVGEGLTFTYQYTFTTEHPPSAEQIEEFNKNVTKALSEQWTPELELTKYYNAGVEFLYQYRDMDWNLMLTVRQKK